MQFVKPEELTLDHFKKLSEPRELTSEEKAEILRLYMSDVTEADLQQYTDWEKAAPFEDLLYDLQEEQKRWDQEHP